MVLVAAGLGLKGASFGFEETKLRKSSEFERESLVVGWGAGWGSGFGACATGTCAGGAGLGLGADMKSPKSPKGSALGFLAGAVQQVIRMISIADGWFLFHLCCETFGSRGYGGS